MTVLNRWIERPTPVLAWAVALLIVGMWVSSQIPMEWIPRVELPVVRLSASWHGNTARAVERYVTDPLEEAVQGVEGTVSVESISRKGEATLMLRVDRSTDLGSYIARVNERISLVEESLPDRATVQLTRDVPEALRDQQGFMTLQLVGPQTSSELRRSASEIITPKLRSIPGVADVVVRGGADRELHVQLDTDRLAAYTLSPDAIQRRLFDATRDAGYGRLRDGMHSVLLLHPSTTSVDALRHLVVGTVGGKEQRKTVHLHDVGSVELKPAPRRSISRIDGNPVVVLDVNRSPEIPMLEVAESVHNRIASLRTLLPPDARLLVADDKSEAVHDQLFDLAWRGGGGLALVLIVLLVLLRSVRAVGIVMFSVAVALAVALLLMKPLGLTLNLLTLAGLVLVFGLLVDNAVVMVEQMMRHQYQSYQSLGTASAEAVQSVALSLLAGTVTTIAMMIPLVYLSGDLKALFLPFGVLAALTLLASLGSAMFLVPVLSRWLPPANPTTRRPFFICPALHAPFQWAARFPHVTLLGLLLLLGTPLWLLPGHLQPEQGSPPSAAEQRWAEIYNATIGSSTVAKARAWLDPALGGIVRPFIQETSFGETFGYESGSSVHVRLVFPSGNPIERADSILKRFERAALSSESVRRTIASTSETEARLQVLFEDAALKTGRPRHVRDRLVQTAVALAGVKVSVFGMLPQGYHSDSGAGVSGLTIAAYGPNYDGLEDLCRQLARRLKRESRRVADVRTDVGRYGNLQADEVLRYRYDPATQERTGVSAQDLASHLRPILSTRLPVLLADVEGTPNVPVRITVKGTEAMDVHALADRPLRTSDSTQVKLEDVAAYTVETTPGRIVRENQRYKRYLKVDFRGPARMGNALIDEHLARFRTPPGYRFERVGNRFFTPETTSRLGWVLLGTIGLVFLVTASVFESWRLPWIVLLSVPMAAIGVAAGFLWTEAVFAEGAFIGTVLLVGIAANDSILLVDRYRRLRRDYPRGRASVLARLAVRDRLKPMWTTTLSTCVAMLPLLVFPTEGDFWTGLAVTVTGGLLAATLLAPLASIALISMQTRS